MGEKAEKTREQRKAEEKKAKLQGRNEYNGISFPAGYNKTLDEFKEEFKDVHIFTDIEPGLRDAEFEKAHKAAINGNTPPTTTSIGKAK